MFVAQSVWGNICGAIYAVQFMSVRVELTAGQFPAGTSVRVGDLGGSGIMATSTKVDTMMVAAMLVTMVTTTTARPVTAP
eukprot:3771247-Pyramimonas_sp.AAC.1